MGNNIVTHMAVEVIGNGDHPTNGIPAKETCGEEVHVYRLTALGTVSSCNDKVFLACWLSQQVVLEGHLWRETEEPGHWEKLVDQSHIGGRVAGEGSGAWG